MQARLFSGDASDPRPLSAGAPGLAHKYVVCITEPSLHFGRQGGSGSQDHPRMEITKGDKAAAAAKSSPEWRSWRETNEGRQGGSGITTIWRLWGSAAQSLRSKNPYSFQLSGEKNRTLASHTRHGRSKSLHVSRDGINVEHRSRDQKHQTQRHPHVHEVQQWHFPRPWQGLNQQKGWPGVRDSMTDHLQTLSLLFTVSEKFDLKCNS